MKLWTAVILGLLLAVPALAAAVDTDARHVIVLPRPDTRGGKPLTLIPENLTTRDTETQRKITWMPLQT